jgi:prepilin-type N-terminal cleavage/methylation domain-containing protein
MKLFQRSKGFTLVEIMIVVAIIGILIAIAVPGFVKARTQSRNRACQENLTKIDGAKEQWALENNKAVGTDVAMTDLYLDDGSGYLKSQPFCPAADGADYEVNAVGTDPACPVVGDNADHILP